MRHAVASPWKRRRITSVAPPSASRTSTSTPSRPVEKKPAELELALASSAAAAVFGRPSCDELVLQRGVGPPAAPGRHVEDLLPFLRVRDRVRQRVRIEILLVCVQFGCPRRPARCTRSCTSGRDRPSAGSAASGSAAGRRQPERIPPPRRTPSSVSRAPRAPVIVIALASPGPVIVASSGPFARLLGARRALRLRERAGGVSSRAPFGGVCLLYTAHSLSVPPHVAGSTSSIDCENVQRWPPGSTALYWRSPYGKSSGSPRIFAPASAARA